VVLRWSERIGPVAFGGTGRSGGVSEGPYSSLNLADHVGDDPAAVAENRRRVEAAAGGPLVLASQVHGTAVLVVDAPLAGPPPQADALVTSTPGLVLTVLVADCTPVLVADPEAGVVGVAHAGRRGMAEGVVAALLAAMREQGAQRMVARVGPSICARCYPVPLALREEVAAVEPVARSVSRRGNPALDVAAGVLAQLRAGDVDAVEVPGCSAEDGQLFSYRRERTTGRYAGLAWIPR
jgi:YfiH family protein